jgi:hypothetical protein
MKQETLRHREAFNYFYSLGGKATKPNATKVSEKWQINERTFWRWYKAFNWQKRVEQRDIEIAKELDKKNSSDVLNSKADYREIIRQTVELYKKKLKEGSIKIYRPQDLKTLAELDLLMMGEATDISQVNSFSDWVQQVNKKHKDE